MAVAAIAGRSSRNLPVNSSAKCIASHILPPLPQLNILLRLRLESAMRLAALEIAESVASSLRRFSKPRLASCSDFTMRSRLCDISGVFSGIFSVAFSFIISVKPFRPLVCQYSHSENRLSSNAFETIGFEGQRRFLCASNCQFYRSLDACTQAIR